MENNYAIIGGDKRISYLAKMLEEEGNNIYSYGTEEIINIKKCDSIKDAIQNSNIIISSIPFSKNGIDIYSPLSDKTIKISELIKLLNDKLLFAGSINDETIILAEQNNVKICDLMKQEDLTVLNTIATAEGAIKEIVENTETNLHGSNALILGFGRVSKVLAKKLKALDANVTTAARKETDFAWMETLGYNIVNINMLGENLKQYDIIINTVPYLIMDYNKLQYVKKECLLLDLASKPGGFDLETCKRFKLKHIWALAIPGKIAPVTSAIYIKRTIEKIIKKEKF